jgi:hypothetical protein
MVFILDGVRVLKEFLLRFNAGLFTSAAVDNLILASADPEPGTWNLGIDAGWPGRLGIQGASPMRLSPAYVGRCWFFGHAQGQA